MDQELLKRLLALMEEGGLTELEYEIKGARIRLARKAEPAQLAPFWLPAPGTFPYSQAPAPAPPQSLPAAGAAAPAGAEEQGVVVVRAPIVGTFYAASGPEAEPFVQVGDRVSPQTTLCILEAMKVMNEIKAEVSGEILSVLVENGTAVEYDQPLFRVRTS